MHILGQKFILISLGLSQKKEIEKWLLRTSVQCIWCDDIMAKGLFLADLLDVIPLYSICQKVSFFLIFGGKFPFSSRKKIRRKIIILSSKS